MAGRPHKIRTIQNAKVADFDDQLWPINCAILILAGFVAGLVIAKGDFSDARLLYNGWTWLTSVGVMVGLTAWIGGRSAAAGHRPQPPHPVRASAPSPSPQTGEG